jgi:hypothetical protein
MIANLYSISADVSFIGHFGSAMLSLVGAIRAPDFGEMTEFIFAMAWAYFAVMAGLGALMVYVGRVRLQSKMAVRIGAGVLVAVAVWAVLAWVVVTPRERLEARHRELLSALEAKNVDGVMGVLGEEFRASALSIDSAAEVRPAVAGAMGIYPVHGARITAMKVSMDGDHASTQVTILADFENLPPTKTAWRFEWIDAAGGDWRLYEARLLSVNDSPAGDYRVPVRLP